MSAAADSVEDLVRDMMDNVTKYGGENTTTLLMVQAIGELRRLRELVVALAALPPAGWAMVPRKVPDSAFPWVSGGYAPTYKSSDKRDQAIIDERAQRTWDSILDGVALSPDGETLVRYCPGCGSVGPVEATYRDCCPDGREARLISQALADKCHDTFMIAVETALAAQAAPQPTAQQEPVAWANWKVGSTSYVPYRTREHAAASVSQSEIAATQDGPYEVVALYREPQQAASVAQGDALRWLQANDMAALERFAETTDDDESYDIGKEAVHRLAGFGCLRSHGFGKYSITDFGHYVLNDWSLARDLPFKSQMERDAARSQAKEGSTP